MSELGTHYVGDDCEGGHADALAELSGAESAAAVPGDAETRAPGGSDGTADPGGGVGRLDRILRAHADLAVSPPLTAAERDAYRTIEMITYGVVSVDGVERLRGMVAALEAECAAMTDALGEATHTFLPDRSGKCQALVPFQGHSALCYQPSAARIHRTPAVVRAEHGFGAL